MTTPTTEAYLEVIYMMETEGQPVIGARLADALHVSRPTVTATIKRLAHDSLVRTNDRREIRLTPKGQSMAEHLQRRHRVVERWLTDELGLDWAASDAEAHHLEHAMSDQVTELLNKHLGFPTTCPHGNAIPGNGAPVASNGNAFPMSAAKEGSRVVVTRVTEYAENVAELLAYLGDRGITPGAQLQVLEIAPLQGPLTLKLGNRIVPLSRQVASYVWVKKADKR